MTLTYIAIDQCGTVYKLKTKHPRKELLIGFGATKADKMYIDLPNGQTKHIGYIIQGRRLTIYSVTRMEKDINM